MNITRKKIYLVIGAYLFISLCIFLYFIYVNRNMTMSVTPIELPDAGIALKEDGSMVFSNGRYFVDYDTASKQTKPLGIDNALPLPSIVNLSTVKNKILFQTQNSDANDLLGKRLADSNVSLFNDNTFWWLYDTDTKTFTPVDARDAANWAALGGDENPTYKNPPTNLKAALSNDGKRIYVLVKQRDASVHLITLNADTMAKESDFKFKEEIHDFYVVNNHIVTVNNGVVSVQTNDGKSIKSIKGDYSVIYSVPNTNSSKIIAYKIEPKPGSNTFYVLDINDGSSYKISKTDAESRQTVSNQGNLVAYRKDGKVILNEKSFITKKYTINIPKEQLTKGGALDIASVVSKDLLLLIDSRTGQYYLAAKNKIDFQDITQEDYPIPNEQCERCSLSFYPDERYFIANILGSYSEEKKAVVYETLRKKNIDPDKVDILFSFFILAPHR